MNDQVPNSINIPPHESDSEREGKRDQALKAMQEIADQLKSVEPRLTLEEINEEIRRYRR